MPYIGNKYEIGDHNNSWKPLDDISSYVATFDGSATNAVSTTNNTIRVPEHRFIQGQRVTYSNGGGGNIGGLTSGTAYYIIHDTNNEFKLATSLANANASTAINLSAVGSGSSHTVTAAFDGVNKKFKITYSSGKSSRFTSATQLSISINNILQRPNDTTTFTDGFRISDNQKIEFNVAPVAADIFWGSILSASLPTFDISDNNVDNFTGDGSTTDFTLSNIPANSQSIIVTVNGVVQHPTDKDGTRAYSLDTSILVFTAAPANGDEIQVRHIGFAGASSSAVTGFYGRTGNVTLSSSADNAIVGVITATQFSGPIVAGAGTSDIVAGIITVTKAHVGGGTTWGEDLVVTGNARVTGILTVGTNSVTITGNDVNITGVTTASNFKTGTTNVHNVGVEAAGINVLGADTPIGTGATIYNSGAAVFTGVVTATTFKGNIVGTAATFTGPVTIGGTLTYEDVTNIDAVGIVTARAGVHIPDNQKLLLGTNTGPNDGEIYSSGSHVYFQARTSGQTLRLTADDVYIRNRPDGQTMARFDADGAVDLYYNTSPKFATTNTGVTIAGIPVATQTTGNVGLELHAIGSGRGSQTKYHNDHGEAYVGTAGDTTGNLLIHNTSNTDMLFATNNTERARITGVGSFGIGTDEPDTLLELSKAVTGTGNLLKITSTENSQSSRPGISFWNNNPNTAQAQISAKGGASYNASKLHFAVANTSRTLVDRACIDEYGTFIIGSGETRRNTKGSSQYQALLVEGTDNNSSRMSMIRSSNDDNGPEIQLIKTRGTSVGSVTKPNGGDYIGALTFIAGDDSDLAARSAEIAVQAQGVPANDSCPGDIIISVTNIGASAPTERLRIGASGITTSNANIDFPDGKMAVFGNSSDLQIWHDSNNSRISDRGGAGNLQIESNNAILMQVNDGTNAMAKFFPTGTYQNEFYNDNDWNQAKLRTTDHGIDIFHNGDYGLQFSDDIGEIGSVAGFQAINKAANANTSFGIRATDIRFATGSTEKVRITSAGKVGIGTNSPSFFTHIQGDGVSNDVLKITARGSGQMVNIQNYSNVPSIVRFANYLGNSFWDAQYNTDNSFSLDYQDGEKFSITSTGQLQATGAADVRLTLGSSGTAGTNNSVHVRADSADLKFMAASGGNTIFEANGTETLRIDSSGRLRVGNTTASADSAFDNLIVGNHSGNVGISILGVDGQQSALGFAKAGLLSDAYIAYNHNSTQTNSNMIIKSGGKIQLFHKGAERFYTTDSGVVVESTGNTPTIHWLGASNNEIGKIDSDAVNGTTSQMRFYTEYSGGLTEQMHLHAGGEVYIRDELRIDRTNNNASGFTRGGQVLNLPGYNEFHYTWSGQSSYTIDLTCASYFHCEFIYTQHQTNGGTYMQYYARGKWANNHTTHTGVMWEWHGDGGGLDVQFTVSDQSGNGAVNMRNNFSNNGGTGTGYVNGGGEGQNTGSANGRLRIAETYNWGSVSNRALIVKVYYGSFSISKS